MLIQSSKKLTYSDDLIFSDAFMWRSVTTQIAKFMGPTWDLPGSCRPQMGPCWPMNLAIREPIGFSSHNNNVIPQYLLNVSCFIPHYKSMQESNVISRCWQNNWVSFGDQWICACGFGYFCAYWGILCMDFLSGAERNIFHEDMVNTIASVP